MALTNAPDEEVERIRNAATAAEPDYGHCFTYAPSFGASGYAGEHRFLSEIYVFYDKGVSTKQNNYEVVKEHYKQIKRKEY